MLVPLPATIWSQAPVYSWHASPDSSAAIARRIPPPERYALDSALAGSFAEWLRLLPLKPGRPEVSLYDGNPKGYQGAHHAVVDIDVGSRDLQQCADVVIRLRAEYLYSRGHLGDISFNFTSGDEASFRSWVEGIRPRVSGSNVSWAMASAADSSYVSFRRYLDVVFTYAGSHSLSRELESVERVRDVRSGDVFIQGGFPGHAVIVLDVATAKDSDEMIVLLGQSYMPAQDFHILRNPSDSDLSPWYRVLAGDSLRTPEWTFGWDDLARFSER